MVSHSFVWVRICGLSRCAFGAFGFALPTSITLRAVQTASLLES
jgi:hypothetical protein